MIRYYEKIGEGPTTPEGILKDERYRLVVEGPPNWTNFRWDTSALFEIYGACRQEQGVLRAQIETLGLEDRLEAQAENLVEEAIKTSF